MTVSAVSNANGPNTLAASNNAMHASDILLRFGGQDVNALADAMLANGSTEIPSTLARLSPVEQGQLLRSIDQRLQATSPSIFRQMDALQLARDGAAPKQVAARRPDPVATFRAEVLSNPLASQLITPGATLDSAGVRALYTRVGYNPAGETEGHLKWFAPIGDLLSAKSAADRSLADAQSSGYPGLHNGQADAFRHAVWNIRMTQSFGEAGARRIGNAHEVSGNNPSGETLMDLINNHNGRILARMYPNTDPVTLARAAVNSGFLQTSPVSLASGTVIPTSMPNAGQPQY